MRILRLRVRNFRGVSDAELRFAHDGATIVHGANEAGKSSFVEALDMLLDDKDSSKRHEVRATQPVGSDVSTEIEMDAEVGPYAFTYRKRFHKEKLTELSISRPKPEQMTGTEAHERVQHILAEHLDVSLWKAIRIAQGTGETLPDLKSQTSLSDALDKVAGGSRASDQEESLFAKVQAEYQRYFTAGKGQPSGAYRDCIAALKEAQAAERDAAEQVRLLEDDVVQAATLTAESTRLQAALADARALVVRCEADVASLRDKREVVHAIEARLGPVAQRVVFAENAVLERERMAAEATASHEASQAATLERSEIEPMAKAAAAALEAVEAAYVKAKQETEDAIALELVRRNDEAYIRNKFDLDDMQGRLARVIEATEKGSAAKRELDGNLVTEERLERIRQAEQSLLAAREVLRTASPKVRVTALEEADVSVGGRSHSLTRGQQIEEPVFAEVQLELAGQVRVTVLPGASAEDLRARVAKAEAVAAECLSDADATSLEHAVGKLALRHAAERAIQDLKRVIRDDLKDWTRDQLERTIQGLQLKVKKHEAQRPPLPPSAIDLREARRFHESAETELAASRRALEEADRQRDAARARAAAIHERVNDVEIRVRMTAEMNLRASALLAAAEQATSYSQLLLSRDALVVEAEGLRAELKAATQSLELAVPDRVEGRLADANEVVARLGDDYERVRDALSSINGVLESKNERGLGELHAQLSASLQRAEREHARMERHAEAARLLFETLSRARDNARRKYVAPLQERINALGRMVRDASFHVEVDDDLSIVSRTLNGRTVPVSGLSQGAKEQLSLLVRLACGMMVAKDGGVPLIFDDVLGASDTGRLLEMAAALRYAAKECQIIVLTCMPSRFDHVPGARAELHAQRALTPSATSE